MSKLRIGAGRAILSSAAAFSPSSITGLAYWFDAWDTATLFQTQATTTPVTTDGQDVRYWSNKAVAADPVQIGAANKCTYSATGMDGLPSVYNGGTGALQRGAGATLYAQPLTIFVVAKHQSVVASSFLMDNVNGTTNRARIPIKSTSVRQMSAGMAIDGSAEDTNKHIHEVLFDGANSLYLVDGALDANGNAGAQGLDGLTLFAGRSLTGLTNSRISEVLIYAAALTANQRAQVRGYLARKWGFQQLP